MATRTLDLISAAALALLGIGAHAVARKIPPRFPTGVDSGFLPEIVSALLVAVAAIIAFGALRRSAEGAAGEAAPETTDGTDASPAFGRVAGTFLLLLAFVLALPSLGFLVSAAGFLALQLLLLAPRGKRRPLLFLAIAILAAASIYGIFAYGFGLILPRGPL